MKLIGIFIFSVYLIIGDSKESDLQEQTYRLVGSHNTYAQYLPWYPCLNSSIIFEFKTHEPNGLLLYSQSLPYKYIQISLVDGNIRLRMRIGEKDNPRGVFLVYDTSQLNDEKWHEVRFVRNNEKTILSVDGKKLYHIHQESILSDLMFGQPDSSEQTNSLFIGGLPDTLQTYNLSHGTVLFEPIFNGFIRNVRALNCSSPFLKLLEVDSYTNLRFVVDSGSCSSNPCLNNGVCLITSGSTVAFKCDCTYTNYEGDLCEIVRPPISNQELTLNGKEYFMVEIPVSEEDSTPAILPSYEVEFNVEFKTSRSTGLLIYAGDVSDYFVLGLQDGAIFFKLNIRGEAIEKSLTIPGTYLNNNHWHSIKFTRKFRSIEILIDDLKKDESNLAGQFMSMSNKFVYVGGVPKKNTIYRAIYKNFVGCIRNVTYKSDTNSFNLISLLLKNSHLVKENGKIERTCKKVMQPITFSSPNSYIPILEWTNYPSFNSFTIEFQTNEKNAVLAYILGAENFQHRAQIDNLMRSRLLSLNRHFFSLEIHNRFLNAYFNLGTNYIRHEVVHEQISDGRSHQLTVELKQQYAIFKFDQNPETSIRISSSDSELLELQSPLVIGGIHPNHRSLSGHNPSTRIPPYFYSAMLGNGYVGCILDLDINGQSVNLTYFAALEGVSGVNTDVCSPMPNQCDIGQCLNEGICIEGWNRFECDCSSTGFNGPICNQPATIANFENDQNIRIIFEPEWVSEAEHISLRFKTERHADSVLLSTYSKYSKDRIELALENTHISLYMKIGDSECILKSIRYGLCDNEWHTVKISREGTRVILQVDNDEPAASKILTAMNKYHSYDSIDLASQFLQHKTSGKINIRSSGSFSGQMQQLIINGKSYFELIANGNLDEYVNRSATFYRSDIPNMHPLKFSANSWISVPKIDASHLLLIQFHLKTTHLNGLILFNKGFEEDFLAIEMFNGQIRFVFSLDSKISVLESSLKDKLNNNKWHLVSIWRATKTNFELTVDSVVFKLSLETLNENLELNLVDDLYIGGYKNNLLSKHFNIMSEYGFKGCLASIEINGRSPDFDQYLKKTEKISGKVVKGCENDFDCLPSTCKNGGLCIEKWDENRIFCDCDATTFTGTYCEKKSIGFEVNKGIAYFDYTSPFYWQEDSLTFAIETRTKDTLLFRAYSGRSNKTLIVEINDGFVQAIFVDLHATICLHTFKNYRINDNQYHKIHMNVFDFDSLLIVDDNQARKEIIMDKKYNQFEKYKILPVDRNQNSIHVEIAGSKYFLNNSNHPEEVHFFNNFNGNIFGLVYNQFRILDLLSLKDQRIRTIGHFNPLQESLLKINELNQNDEYYSSQNLIPQIPKYETKNNEDNSFNQEPYSESISTKQSIMTNAESINFSSMVHGTSDANQLKESIFGTNLIVLIIFGSVILVIVLIYAFCKYRSLDEGTYTIDEAQNCGPFAELDVPLNSSSKSGRKIKNKRKIMLNASNKEWFV